MSERRFDPSEAAWRLVSERAPAAAGRCAFCPTLPGAPPSRIPHAEFEIAVLDDSGPADAEPVWPSAGPPYGAKPAFGAAETVVYTDDHEATLGTVGRERLELLVHVWADRYRELGDRREIAYVYVFESPQATVSHPHSRVHGYPTIPPRAQRKLEQAQAHLDAHGTCLHCDVVAREQADGVRVVAENDCFIAFVPFAPRFAYEVHVLARRHACSLNDITDPERVSLAELLSRVVPAYESSDHPRAPYAMGISQAPTDDGRRQPVSHFQIELTPALGMLGGAGPELGAGMYFIDARPEDTAARLRAALRP